MIITTTPNVEGMNIQIYKGLVFGEVIEGINLVKDFKAGISNVLGGRSKSYENELIKARTDAESEMAKRAEEMGANAVVGVKFDYESLGQGGMLMVTCSGTAVVVE